MVPLARLNIAGWLPNQGISGKVGEFTCCLKKVKNSQGKRHKNVAKSGKKDLLEIFSELHSSLMESSCASVRPSVSE